MDSKLIAPRLERDYPSPSLHLDSPILQDAYQLIAKIANPLHAVWMPKVPVNLLNQSSSEYFYRTREEDVGKPLSVYAKENGGEEAWIEALPAINALAEVVKKNGGPFVMGKTRKLIYSCREIANSKQLRMRILSSWLSSNSSRLLKRICINVWSRLTQFWGNCMKPRSLGLSEMGIELFPVYVVSKSVVTQAASLF